MKKDIKVKVYPVDHAWIARAQHEVPNGSTIEAEGETLPLALEALAEKIRHTELKDPIWKVAAKTGLEVRIEYSEDRNGYVYRIVKDGELIEVDFVPSSKIQALQNKKSQEALEQEILKKASDIYFAEA